MHRLVNDLNHQVEIGLAAKAPLQDFENLSARIDQQGNVINQSLVDIQSKVSRQELEEVK